MLDGTKRGPMPIQPLSLKDMIEDTTAFTNEFDEDFSNSSEDCLYLDVYTTSVNPKADKMPVGRLRRQLSDFTLSLITRLREFTSSASCQLYKGRQTESTENNMT